MYTDFYRLTGFPFQLTPDHRFFFDSGPHRKAMAYLSYGLSKGEGFIVITGEIGAGKTTLIDHLVATLHGKMIATARVVTSKLGANDLLALTARGFGVGDIQRSKASLLAKLEDRLVENRRAGVRSLLVIDEVQSMREAALEELRMLSNFGLAEQPVLQICLVGQPEFRATLATERFEQLRQRIIASHHLFPLDAEESRGYIQHRLQRVGWRDDPRIDDAVYGRVHEETGGIPRKINLLCDRLMLFGYLEERHELSIADLEDVIIDMREEFVGPVSMPPDPAKRSDAAPTPALPESLSTNDVTAIRRKLAELERLLPAARADTPATAAGPEPRAPAAPPSELEELLERVSLLKRQLKGTPE